MEGGHSTHFLLPRRTAFQAEVEFGSCRRQFQICILCPISDLRHSQHAPRFVLLALWKELPDLVGPQISQRQSGRQAPSTEKRSSEKIPGT